VIDQLLEAGVPVRALARRSEAAAMLPANVEVVNGDLTVPESLDTGLRGVGTAFLVWTAPPTTAAAVVERLANHARRVVFLSAPATAIRAIGVVRWPYGAAETAAVDDRDVAAVAARTLYQDGHAGGDYVLTGPESLSQAEQVSIIGDVLGRRIVFEELSPEEFRSETEGSWPGPIVDMLPDAWGATIGRPAFITSTVFDIQGSPPRSFASGSPITPPRSSKTRRVTKLETR
jgi:uncharacterized protein YbjT (DUF2867 family)